MIRQMVIDTCPALTLHFLGVAQVTAITMFIVTPQQRDVLRHLQSVMIGIQHLFVSA